MPRQHAVPLSLPYGTDSKVFLSINPANRLVVFIHGFNGRSLGTWDEFQQHILQDAAFANSDVLFYGYKSLRSQAAVSGAFFLHLLRDAADPAASGIFPNRAGLPGGYPNILIVAHSLGAIVTRFALLDALQANEPWIARVRMVLFAPAHLGAMAGKVASECLSGPFKLLPFLAHTRFPVLQDLIPGSQCLTELLDRTRRELSKGRNGALVAHTVVWAEHEAVVSAGRFGDDPPAIPISGRHHTSVCKPVAPYLDPVQLVINAFAP